jgi:hypothetical protein
MDPVVRIDRSQKIPVYYVRKVIDDPTLHAMKRTFLEEKHFKVILTSDADVYTESGDLLIRFRKNVLSKAHIEAAYEAMKTFIHHKSTDRGVATGSEKGVLTGFKPTVKSNIMGYFDKWSVKQRSFFKTTGIKAPGKCRITRFTGMEPEKWKRVIPLIQDIDAMYKTLCPDEHASQWRAAHTTPFYIPKTSFSTVTTNVNFRTAAHFDKGDWTEGFGNLVVIEHGAPYKGAYTGIPQYGIAVDCRTGDFLAMDVHHLHGNTPMIPTDDSSERLSLVCYLREGIVRNCGSQKMYDPIRLYTRMSRAMKKIKSARQTRRKPRAAADV